MPETVIETWKRVWDYFKEECPTAAVMPLATVLLAWLILGQQLT